ncbi:MAG: EAL domain-containing protein [Lachnospiraceae bacterium]|nr:EAL domain-containing protein [Lachnospiraceae bacterium]
MFYHIEFDIAAVFVTLFIVYYVVYKKGLRRHANRVFLVMLLLGVISEFSDIFSSLCNNYPDEFTRSFMDFWNYVYLCTHNVMAFLLDVYVFYLLGYQKSKPISLYFLALPITFDIIVLLTNPFHELVFYYDELDRYTHGPLFIVLYIVSISYMVFAVYLAVRHNRVLTKGRSAALLFFILISFIPLVVQMFIPEYLVTLFFESLGMMGILFTIENKDDVINPITGIYNRFALEDALSDAMASNDKTLLMVKIPNLNYYNKMIGFENMNGILSKISMFLETEFTDFMCYDCNRGHFAMIGDRIDDAKIEEIKKKIFDRFEESWGKGKITLAFPVQFGAIQLPEDVKTMENLQMIIDASFDEKRSSVMDVPQIIAEYERRVLVERLIDKALKNKSFQVYYQPIWDYHTGKVRSAEALCRLIDDEFGFIAPDEFIPIAEQNGTVLEIGRFVFEEVCRFYNEGRLQDLGINYIEVNLSVVQCVSRNIKESFDEILKKYNLDSNCINLEITESATADNHKVLIDTIGKLSESGFLFSLDDYGTGYSNIAYMYEMPFSIIKIDKSILWKAMQPENGEGLDGAIIYLENTIRMLKNMNYYVLVEGVETLEQKMLLERMGCDYFQGFYFSKPVQKQVFADYLKVVNA